jgi:hypothetical protein
MYQDLLDKNNDKENCDIVRDDYCKIDKRNMILVSRIIILTLAGFHLIKEMFQLTQVRCIFVYFYVHRIKKFGKRVKKKFFKRVKKPFDMNIT